jgi:hypothetical protein
VEKIGCRRELPDNVKSNLGRNGMVSLPRNTEKSKLIIIKATGDTKYVYKEEGKMRLALDLTCVGKYLPD